MIKASFRQGELLSIAEVATIMNRGILTIQRRISQYQKEKGEVLPLKGNILDQGSSPTHKRIVIQLYVIGDEKLGYFFDFSPCCSHLFSPAAFIPALCPDELEIPKQSSTKANKVRVYIFKREGR